MTTETWIDLDGVVDLDLDTGFERYQKTTTELLNSGNRITEAEVQAENGDLLSKTKTETRDDNLKVTVSRDTDGDGAYDLVHTETTFLPTNGETRTISVLRDRTDTSVDPDGAIRAQTTTLTSENGRVTTIDEDLNGDNVTDVRTWRSTLDDGKLMEVVTATADDGTRQSRVESSTTGNELVIMRRINADGNLDSNDNDIFERIERIATVSNDNGSKTTTTTARAADLNSFASKSEITTSDDGREVTETRDYNGDGTNDLTRVTTRALDSAGIETITEERKDANGNKISLSSTVTTADRRSVTTSVDADDNGNNDSVVSVTKGADGTVTTEEQYFSSGGTLEARTVSYVSDDGLQTVQFVDRNNDGRADYYLSDITDLNADGSTSRRIEHTIHNGTLLAAEEYEISDDGLVVISRFDTDGVSGFDFLSEDVTTFETETNTNHATGGTKRVQTTRDSAGTLLNERKPSSAAMGL